MPKKQFGDIAAKDHVTKLLLSSHQLTVTSHKRKNNIQFSQLRGLKKGITGIFAL